MKKTNQWVHSPEKSLILLGILVSIPFLFQPYSIDDPIVLFFASSVLDNPITPYSAPSNWFDVERTLFDDFHNPPLSGYVVAAILRLFGPKEFFMHLYTLFLYVISITFFYRIADLYLENAFPATIAWMFLPVIFVQSHHLMPDLLCLDLLLVSLYFALMGMTTGGLVYFILSGLLGGFCTLAKYNGLLWFPIIAGTLFFLSMRQHKNKLFIALAIGVIVQSIWQLYSLFFYGQFHVFSSAPPLWGEATSFGEKLLAQSIHTSMNLSGLLLLFVSSSRAKKPLFWIISIPFSLLFIHAYNSLPLVSILTGLLSIILFSIVIVRLVEILQEWVVKKKMPIGKRNTLALEDEFDVYFSVWVFIGFFATLAMTPFMAGRYLLLWIAPLFLLLFKSFENLYSTSKHFRNQVVFICCFTAIIGLGVGISDFSFSAAHKNLALMIGQQCKSSRVYFTGHWGFQYYMQQQGYIPMEATQHFQVSDLIARAFQSSGSYVPEEILNRTKRLMTLKITPSFPVSIMDRPSGAGFYLHYDRPLAWSFCSGQPIVVEIREFLY